MTPRREEAGPHVEPRRTDAALVARWRADTPGVGHVCHLNNAGAALMPQCVYDTMHAHLNAELLLGGYEAAEACAGAVAGTYDAVARLVGAESRNVAVVENATVAFTQALSAIPLARGDRVVTTSVDYASHLMSLISLRDRLGIEVCVAGDLPGGGVDPADVARLAADRRCKAVVVSWVPTSSGLVQDVHAVGGICAEHGVPYIVDACQVVGQLPVDVASLRCDYLTATARKWLRGPRGIGFLYVSDSALTRGDVPLFPDAHGVRWEADFAYVPSPSARRFENWEFSYALLLGLGTAARYAMEAGVERTGDRTRALAALVRRRLAATRVQLLETAAHSAAIITVAVPGVPASEAVALLRTRGVNTSSVSPGWARRDLADRGAASALRISPHYYNTTEEVDLLVESLQDIVSGATRDIQTAG